MIVEEGTDSEDLFIREDKEEDGATNRTDAKKAANMGMLTPTKRKINFVATADERIGPDYNTLSPMSNDQQNLNKLDSEAHQAENLGTMIQGQVK